MTYPIQSELHHYRALLKAKRRIAWARIKAAGHIVAHDACSFVHHGVRY